MGCRLLASSIHVIFQARILEWVAIFFSLSTVPPGKSSSSFIVSILFQKWGCSIGFSPNWKQTNKQTNKNPLILRNFFFKILFYLLFERTSDDGKYFKNRSFLGFHNWFSLDNISPKGEERSSYGTLLSQNFTSLSFSEKHYEVEIFSNFTMKEMKNMLMATEQIRTASLRSVWVKNPYSF